MKGIFLKTELNNALEKFADVIEKNSISEILRHIFIKFEDDKAVIIGTDGNMQLTVKIEGKIEKTGEIAVNFKDFFSIIKNFPDENITLRLSNNKLDIYSTGSKLSLPTRDTKEFIFLDEKELPNEIVLRASDIINGLQKTILFASPKVEMAVAPEFTGILIEIGKDEIVFGATDTVILAKVKIDGENDIKERQRILLPIKAAKNILKILQKDLYDLIKIKYDEKCAKISFENTSYWIHLLDESIYIDINLLFQKPIKTSIKVNTHNFKNLLKPLLSVMDKKTSCLCLSYDGMNLTVFIYNSVIDGNILLPAQPIKGKDLFSVYVDPQNLLKAISNIQSTEMELGIGENNKMLFFYPAEQSNLAWEGYICATINFDI